MSTTEPRPEPTPVCVVCGNDATGSTYTTPSGQTLCSSVCLERSRGAGGGPVQP
jgi:hypothetical protein